MPNNSFIVKLDNMNLTEEQRKKLNADIQSAVLKNLGQIEIPTQLTINTDLRDIPDLDDIIMGMIVNNPTNL